MCGYVPYHVSCGRVNVHTYIDIYVSYHGVVQPGADVAARVWPFVEIEIEIDIEIEINFDGWIDIDMDVYIYIYIWICGYLWF